MRDITQYEDMLHLPHHTSVLRPRMSNLERAAQFSPFAALTGYEAAIAETARQTDTRAELDESEKALLNEKLQILRKHIDRRPAVTITYFRPDERKAGGAYVRAAGTVQRIDETERRLVLADRTTIPIEQIYAIEFSAAPRAVEEGL